MLCITMRNGEYFTIGDDIVIRLEHLGDERARLAIQAPRDLSILRGEVLERNGGDRPDCLWGKAPVSNG